MFSPVVCQHTLFFSWFVLYLNTSLASLLNKICIPELRFSHVLPLFYTTYTSILLQLSNNFFCSLFDILFHPHFQAILLLHIPTRPISYKHDRPLHRVLLCMNHVIHVRCKNHVKSCKNHVRSILLSWLLLSVYM